MKIEARINPSNNLGISINELGQVTLTFGDMLAVKLGPNVAGALSASLHCALRDWHATQREEVA